MKKALRPVSLVTCIGIAILVLTLCAPALAADSSPSKVKGKVFAVMVQPSFGGGTTFADCFRFTDTTMAIDGCGDSGPLVEVPLLGTTPFISLWIGSVPCSGLNLVFIGTSVDGSKLPIGLDQLGGSAIGKAEGSTFSALGTAVASCPASSVKNGMNYKKPDTK